MTDPAFPSGCDTVGKKVAHVSGVLLPARRFEEYLEGMRQVLAEDVHYVDPVHELRGREAVLEMLEKYVPRAANEHFRFELLVDEPHMAVWRWTMSLTIRFAREPFVINGLVHAVVQEGRVVYQREYYDPMESIGVFPFVGKLWKKLLRSA